MRRGSGILLHISSLPSEYGVGDLGPGAYGFVNFLMETKQTYWQMLPLNPTNPGAANSPYNSLSALAGNPLFVSPDKMVESGWLKKSSIEDIPDFSHDKVDYEAATKYKEGLLKEAFSQFRKEKSHYGYEKFCFDNSVWLQDFAEFMAIRKHYGEQGWNSWPPEIRDRNPEALAGLRKELHQQIEMEKFFQFMFFSQWHDLKSFCNERGIQLVGDIPYYVSYDSSDVWTQPELFKLDESKNPVFVAGVPPDYFSATGQLWGNPVYNWDLLRKQKYGWWIQRMRYMLNNFDMVRIDHFRGFSAYWEVPAHEDTAINGSWIDVPGVDFFNVLRKYLPNLPIIAEDLGVITADVRELIQTFDFPGMRVLVFGFDNSLPGNPYAPHNYVKNCVVYTGTHDNNTARGWYENDISEDDRHRLHRYLGENPSSDIHWELIRTAMLSVASVAIIPMQDVLGLGCEARMNFPSTVDGNWQWRLSFEQVQPDTIERLSELVWMSGRE